MSLIYALIVCSSSKAKKFCQEFDSFALRAARAEYFMSGFKDESCHTLNMCGCFTIVTGCLDPVMLRTLLRIIRDESYDKFPYPPKTYEQEVVFEKKLTREIPVVYGNENSGEQIFWRVPQEILEYMVQIEKKKQISKLAKQWRMTFNQYPADELDLKSTKMLLRDLQEASIEAIRTKKKAFVFCST